MAGRLALTALDLSHFRSHRRSRLALDGRPVAIFGANGSGKTNLLEAVSLLSPGRGLRRAAAEELSRRPEALGWRVLAEIDAGREHHQVVLRAEAGQGRTLTLDEAPVPQARLAALWRVLWLVPAMDRLWTEGPEGRRRFLDRIAMSFTPAHAEAALTYEKAMRERNRLLRDGGGDPAWFSALEGRMAEAGAQIAANRRHAVARIAQAQDETETAFPVAALEIIGVGPEDETDLAAALSANRRADIAAGRSLIGPHRADLSGRYAAKDMPAAQASTGEQKALLISLVLANARALRDDTDLPPLLLLDEVAAHLDADRRAALYDEIDALGSQAFMTGTGPELFAPWGDRAQFWKVAERDGVSAVKEVQP